MIVAWKTRLYVYTKARDRRVVGKLYISIHRAHIRIWNAPKYLLVILRRFGRFKVMPAAKITLTICW